MAAKKKIANARRRAIAKRRTENTNVKTRVSGSVKRQPDVRVQNDKLSAREPAAAKRKTRPSMGSVSGSAKTGERSEPVEQRPGDGSPSPFLPPLPDGLPISDAPHFYGRKIDVNLRIPSVWLEVTDHLAELYSSALKIFRRSDVLRTALDRGLAQITTERGIAWPPIRRRFSKRKRKMKPDYAALATKKIIALLRDEKVLSRMAIRRALNHHDRTAMEDALTFLIHNRYVRLHQESTPGRSRAMYTWLGGVDGDVTEGEVQLIVSEIATARALGIKRAVEWRREGMERDRQRRLREWDEMQERVAEKKAEKEVEERKKQRESESALEGFRPPEYAPPSDEASKVFDQLHADYEKSVREPDA